MKGWGSGEKVGATTQAQQPVKGIKVRDPLRSRPGKVPGGEGRICSGMTEGGEQTLWGGVKRSRFFHNEAQGDMRDQKNTHGAGGAGVEKKIKRFVARQERAEASEGWVDAQQSVPTPEAESLSSPKE